MNSMAEKAKVRAKERVDALAAKHEHISNHQKQIKQMEEERHRQRKER